MRVPQHVLIIPDGNRRWAKKRSYKIFFGHSYGAKVVESIALAALEQNIKCLTFWGLSMDNLKNRSETELLMLFEIFEEYFKKLSENAVIHDHQVRIRAIGCWEEHFPPATVRAILIALETTKNHARHSFNFLLADGEKARPWPEDIPDIDLIIRTGETYAESGIGHLSDGMRRWPMKDPLIQFSATLWPDFSASEFTTILSHYALFERRSGK